MFGMEGNSKKSMDMLVVDDHKIIFDGIKSMLEENGFINSLDYCASLAQLKSRLGQYKYDILVLDLNLSGENALNAIKEIRFIKPKIKIIILTSYESSTLVQKAKELGVDGYLLKNTTQKQFVEALQKIASGEKYFQKFNETISAEFEQSIDSFGVLNSLSNREQELVQCLLNGLNEKEIAEKLFISRHTVRTHKKNIFKKLNVSGVMGLIKSVKGNSS